MKRYWEVQQPTDDNYGRHSKTVLIKYRNIAIDASVILVLLFTWIFGVHRINVEPGHEAVLVKKPYLSFLSFIPFFQGGIDSVPVPTGSIWVAATTEATPYPIVPIEYPETFKDMNTSDNFPVDFETNLQLQIVAGQGPKLIGTFGQQWYINNIKQKYREIVRDEIGKYKMTPLVVRSQELDTAQSNIMRETAKYIESIGISVRLIRITFSKINPDDQVMHERARTAAEQQRIQSEGQRKLAEDGRKLAEESRALADKAYADKMGLSPSQFVSLESVKAGERMMAECVKSGKGGCNMLVTTGGGSAQPVMTLK